MQNAAQMVEQVSTAFVPDEIPLTKYEGDPFDLPYALELRPRFEFGFEAAKTKLASLRIGEADGPRVTFVIPGDVHAYDDYEEYDDGRATGVQAKLLQFSGWVSMDSNLTVS